ncbi:hypothetical protein E2C01_094375 [Portunus trituberculatus]|uniref:Uncharacterized protein n=1 Tax=Portunus trituberculatus TaxID=210409 RepID=A0A5B7JWZ9_PORTR|nr:hypothetical protein [Portunus trituberculatus]
MVSEAVSNHQTVTRMNMEMRPGTEGVKSGARVVTVALQESRPATPHTTTATTTTPHHSRHTHY